MRCVCFFVHRLKINSAHRSGERKNMRNKIVAGMKQPAKKTQNAGEYLS